MTRLAEIIGWFGIALVVIGSIAAVIANELTRAGRALDDSD